MDVNFFSGLNNVTDPLRAGLKWMTVADNVNITNTGGMEVRSGYSRAQAGSFTGVYTTKDFQRMYLVDNGNLRTYDGTVLKTGISSADMFWTEINEQVFYNNGVDAGVILPDNTVVPWRWTPPTTPTVRAVTGNLPAGAYLVRVTTVLDDGRETGTSDAAEITLTAGQALQISGLTTTSNVYIAPANSTIYQLAYTGSSAFVWNSSMDTLGRELQNIFLDPLPNGATIVQAWRGVIYAAQYLPAFNQTAIWFTEPMGYHLFNMNSNFISVPGEVTMLAPTKESLIIGTDSRIYATDGKSLEVLAEYGVIPGQHWAEDGEDRILFWTTRGVCAAKPFTNLTERQVSVPPGVQAGGTIVRSGGQKRYVVALHQGGAAFNQYL